MRVLVVDDSLIYRRTTTSVLEKLSFVEAVSTASNGKIALGKLNDIKPDVIVLDLEMPVMDGISTIKEIRKTNKEVKILVFSSLSQRGAEITMNALKEGANDFLTKTGAGSSLQDSLDGLKTLLEPKIQQFQKGSHLSGGGAPSSEAKNDPFSTFKSRTSGGASQASSTENTASADRGPSKFATSPQDFARRYVRRKPKIYVIGSSTGGPNALAEFFEKVKSPPSVPVLLVQHMPPFFTEQLATMLTKQSKLTVRQAIEGEKLENGIVYIAPGDYHMWIEPTSGPPKVVLGQGPQINFVRPAVDPMFESVAKIYGDSAVGFVLTGMGSDGCEGAKILKAAGSKVVIQDEETSVVWGMPGHVHAAGAFDCILPIADIGAVINECEILPSI